MITVERITAVIERARVAGGFVDEDVARAVLAELGLDEDGKPADDAAANEPEGASPPAEHVGQG